MDAEILKIINESNEEDIVKFDESKHKNEFLNNIDVEEGRNEILRRFQDLSEVMEEISYDVRPTKEQIGLYSSIESIATDIMRTADYMQVSLEDE